MSLLKDCWTENATELPEVLYKGIDVNTLRQIIQIYYLFRREYVRIDRQPSFKELYALCLDLGFSPSIRTMRYYFNAAKLLMECDSVALEFSAKKKG